jgi:hypothetical protein
MENEFELRTYNTENGEIGLVLVNMFNGRAYTNIEDAEHRTGTTHVSVPHEEVGTKTFTLMRNEVTMLQDLFDLEPTE